MTVQEAIEKLKYIKYIGNGEQEYKKCSESIAIDMAIEALEKQIKLEEVVARLEEQAEECKKYWDKFDDEDAFGGMNAYFNAIAIVKEGMG